MTFLTNKQQQTLEKLKAKIQEEWNNKPKEEKEKILEILKAYSSPYQPTCRTEEDMRKCDNTSK